MLLMYFEKKPCNHAPKNNSNRFVMNPELMLLLRIRDTELQRCFDAAVLRRDALRIEIAALQAEKQQMEDMIEKCYSRAVEQGTGWAL